MGHQSSFNNRIILKEFALPYTNPSKKLINSNYFKTILCLLSEHFIHFSFFDMTFR